MINEAYELWESLDQENIDLQLQHKMIQPCSKGPSVMVFLSENGDIFLDQIKYPESKLRFFDSIKSMFPAFPMSHPSKWNDTEKTTIRQRIKFGYKLANQLNIPEITTLASRCMNLNLDEFSMHLTHWIDKSKLNLEPNKKIQVIFEIRETSSRPVSCSEVYEEANRILNNITGDKIDIFGNKMSVAKLSPKANLPILGPRNIRALNEKAFCNYRYGKSGIDSYPIGTITQQRCRAALEWITHKDRKEKTWIGLPSKNKTILFAYAKEMPTKSPKVCMIFGETNDDSDYESECTKVIESIKSALLNDFSMFNIVLLIEAGKSSTKVDSYSITSCNLKQSISDWNTGCDNHCSKPCKISPMNFVSLSKTHWNRGFKQQSSNALLSIQPSECMKLYLEKDYNVDKLLSLIIERQKRFVDEYGNLRAMNPRSNKISEKESNLQKRLPPALGILLYKKGITKDDLMNKACYNLGSYFQVCDRLHAMYCNIVRNSHPPRYVGSELLQSALQDPHRSFVRLNEKVKIYLDWARKFVANENDVKKENEKYIPLVKWLIGKIHTFGNAICSMDGIPMNLTNTDKGEFFLGYLASLKKDMPVNGLLTTKENEND